MKSILKMPVAALLLASAAVANAADCGHVTIAALSWQSNQLQANVDQLILKEGYGCNAETVMGDTVPTITSMRDKEKPDMVSEIWVDTVPTQIFREGTASGKLVPVTESLSEGGINAWFIPEYFAKEHPEIRTIADVMKHPELFPSPENPERAAIFNGTEGWGWTVITAQLYKAFNMQDAGFDLVSTGSGAALDSTVVRAAAQKKGWVGYYWAPTSLMGKYPMVQLDPGVPFDNREWERCTTKANCPDPKPNGWPKKSTVNTIITGKFAKRIPPEVLEYLKARSYTTVEMNRMLAWMTDNQATGEDAAKYFLRTYPEIWTKWVPADVKAKVEKAIG